MKSRLTEQEIWTLGIVALLLLLGICGKIWMAHHPPKPLPSLPEPPSLHEEIRSDAQM